MTQLTQVMCANVLWEKSHSWSPLSRRVLIVCGTQFLKLLISFKFQRGFIFCSSKSDISLWYDKRLHLSFPSQQVLFVHISDAHLKLQDVYKIGSWNFVNLYTTLPSHVQSHIQDLISDNHDALGSVTHNSCFSFSIW